MNIYHTSQGIALFATGAIGMVLLAVSGHTNMAVLHLIIWLLATQITSKLYKSHKLKCREGENINGGSWHKFVDIYGKVTVTFILLYIILDFTVRHIKS